MSKDQSTPAQCVAGSAVEDIIRELVTEWADPGYEEPFRNDLERLLLFSRSRPASPTAPVAWREALDLCEYAIIEGTRDLGLPSVVKRWQVEFDKLRTALALPQQVPESAPDFKASHRGERDPSVMPDCSGADTSCVHLGQMSGAGESIARIIYETNPGYEPGEYVDGFQVSPGGDMAWDQAKKLDAEFAPEYAPSLTQFAYEAADRIIKLLPSDRSPAQPGQTNGALDCHEYMPLALTSSEPDSWTHQVMDADTAYIFRIIGSRDCAERVVAALNAAYDTSVRSPEQPDPINDVDLPTAEDVRGILGPAPVRAPEQPCQITDEMIRRGMDALHVASTYRGYNQETLDREYIRMESIYRSHVTAVLKAALSCAPSPGDTEAKLAQLSPQERGDGA